MSRAVLESLSRANLSAFNVAASTKGLLKWVPVAQIHRAEAMKSGLINEKEYNKIVDPNKMIKPD